MSWYTSDNIESQTVKVKLVLSNFRSPDLYLKSDESIFLLKDLNTSPVKVYSLWHLADLMIPQGMAI